MTETTVTSLCYKDTSAAHVPDCFYWEKLKKQKKKIKFCVIIDYFLGLLGPFLYFLIFGGKSFFVGKSDHYSRKSNEQTEVRTELFWFCLKQEATRQQRCLFYDRTDGDTTWTGSGEASGCEGW